MLKGCEVQADPSFSRIAGVDEVGYGAWAGPVWVAAVIIKNSAFPLHILDLIQDSKKMRSSDRQKVFDFFTEYPEMIELAMAVASPAEIDQTNVLKATHAAIYKALHALNPDFSLVDGCRAIDPRFPHRTIIRGDQKIQEIALAAIIAKVTRDRYMSDLAKEHPEFGWEKNKGYGTFQHRTALSLYPATSHHRLSWPCCAVNPLLL
jgi:ribonuclease HII